MKARPLIVGFLKVRNENVRDANVHRCLANMEAFCDTIVACDDASSDGTRELLERHPLIPKEQLVLVSPAEQDFRAEIQIKQRMLDIVHDLRPHWIWWQDGDEELEEDGVKAIRKFCEQERDNTLDGYRFKYLQLWRSPFWYRVDEGFADGSFIKLWKWSPNLSFPDDQYGTHFAQFPQQIRLDRVQELPWRVIHWGNCGVNLRWKCVQYHGGLGGVERHMSFEGGTFKQTPKELLPKRLRDVPPMEVTQAYPNSFTAKEKKMIRALRSLKHEPGMFTVVIPTRNRASYLEQGLSSLVAQTYEKWIALVLDDGSTDDTPEVMRQWQERDPRVFYARYPQAGAVALNEIGMDLACEWTEWWTRLGSDDYFEPHKLQLDATALSMGAKLTYGPYRVLRRASDDPNSWNLQEMCNLPMNAGDAKRILSGGGFVLSWANIASTTDLLRSVKDHYGAFCDPRLKVMEDFLVNARLVRFADPVFRCRKGRATVVDPDVTLEEWVKGADHDAIWRVNPVGASSDVVTTGDEGELTRQIIEEENAKWNKK